MYIVIAMAGEGKRFIDYGFSEPKFKLIVKDKPLFDWAVMSLSSFYKKATFIFVSQEGCNDFVSQRCGILGIHSFRLVELKGPTNGQATTVMKGVESLDPARPLLIYNIDTHINPEVLEAGDIEQNFSGWLLLFSASGTHWSFARLGRGGEVVEVSEKVCISEYASTGLYYFSSIAIFKEAYSSLADEIKGRYREIYVAPLYQYLINSNQRVGSKIIDFENVIPLGTPEEVAKFDSEFFARYHINREVN